MQRKCLVPAIVFLCLLLVGPPAVMAQTTGTLRGSVEDPDGSPLPGATVTISSEAILGGTMTRVTGANGSYNFSGLAPGSYDVTVELEGFRSVTEESVRVGLNQAASVSFSLQLASVEETVTVSGRAPVIDLSSSKVSTNFDSQFIEDLPTTRNFYDLIQVAPGMSNSWKQGTSDRTVAFGSNQQSNAWQVDGLNLTAPETGSSWMDVNPDAIEEIQVMGIGAPAEYGNASGGAFNIVTKRGGNSFSGTANFFWQTESLTGINVRLDDVPPGNTPHYVRDFYREFTGTLGGPIVKDRAWFFLSGRYQRDAAIEPRNDPAFIPVNKSDILDAKVTMRFGENNFLDLVGHYDNWDAPYDVSAFQTQDAFSGEKGKTPGWNVQYRRVFSDETFGELKYGGWWADDIRESATGSLDPAFVDFTPTQGGPARISDGVWWPWTYITWHHQLSADVSHYADDFIEGDHDFKFGVQASRGSFDTKVAAGPTGYYLAHYYGYYYKVEQLPYRYGGINTAVGAYVDDSWTVNDNMTLNVGVRLDYNKGRIPEYNRLEGTGFPDWQETSETKAGHDVLDDLSVAPRLGIAVRPTDSGSTVVRGSFGIYYDGNVGGNWDAPTVDPPPYTWFWLPNWPDTSGGINVFQITGGDRDFDPDLKLPKTYQTSVGFEHSFAANYSFGAQYVYKSTSDLIGWELIGGEYERVPFTDPFSGNTFELCSIVENPTTRKGNQPGNVCGDSPDSYWQKYHGLILTFNKRWSNNWSMQASYTLSKSWGLIPRMLSSSQFNPFYGSLEGSDPNNFFNADQRLQGDRPHMFRVQGNLLLPGDIDFTTVVNLQSGRPFNRQIRPGQLSQGSVRVIMTPAGEQDPEFGELRYPFEKRVDVALGKRFDVGDVRLKLDAQAFNLTNEGTHTLKESLVIQPGDRFLPTDFVWPRRLQLRLGLEF